MMELLAHYFSSVKKDSGQQVSSCRDDMHIYDPQTP